MHALTEGGPLLMKAAPFELRVLGPVELVHRPSGDLLPAPAKMRALMAYLSAAPRSTETRRRLAGLLWASSGEDQARQSLRMLLSNFRRSAERRAADILVSDEAAISLAPALVAVDRTTLMDLPPQAGLPEMMRAADLYRNDFALGADIGEEEFDAWLRAERAKSKDAAVALFDRLIRALIERGRHQDALARANRLAEIDPLREETHRLVIAEEAIVSGRASAMQRYETFRMQLREGLSVHPEAATLRLLDDLRRQKTAEIAPPDAADPAAAQEGTTAPPLAPIAVTEKATIAPAPVAAARRLRPARAAALAIALLAAAVATQVWRSYETSAISPADSDIRASVVLAPFETGPGLDDLGGRALADEIQTRLAFARNGRLAMAEFPEAMKSRDPASLGRALHVGYVVKTGFTKTADGFEADIRLFDAATGYSIYAASVPTPDDNIMFARELYKFVYPQIVLHRAGALAASEPGSTRALLWQAFAEQIKTRVGATDMPEIGLFDAVLNKDSDQLYALLGLATSLTLRAGRDVSPTRAEDVKRIASLLTQARGLTQNLAELTFLEGMLHKLNGEYDAAYQSFERTLDLDPTHWSATAHAAHVKMFLGRFDEAYAEMEAVSRYLLTDVSADGLAFIAGETALMAGHADRAATHFRAAVDANAAIPRLHAWLAVALWKARLPGEARAEAATAQNMAPKYGEDNIRNRGKKASVAYQDKRNDCAQAFHDAFAYTQTN
jgi:DNA-binding SARP family transcriptional activator/tetratricopeptide (TPR) repeat protein